MDFNEATEQIKLFSDKLYKDPIHTHDDKLIHKTIMACSVVLPYFINIPRTSVQDVLYDNHKQIGFTLNTFYNETVAFILESKKRSVVLPSWSAIFTGYMNDLASTQNAAQTGSLGMDMINATKGIVGEVRNYGESHQTVSPTIAALSYAHHDLLALWLTRLDGLNDMVLSFAIFLKITRP